MCVGNIPLSTARRFMFTINNYSSKHITDLNMLKNNPKVDYVCWGLEIAPLTGTLHIQGYIEFAKATRPKSCQKIVDYLVSCHLCNCLPVNGEKIAPRDRFINYCRKDDVFTEIENKKKHQGSVFSEAIEFIETNPSFIEFAKEFPELAIKYSHGIENLITKFDENNQKQLCQSLFEDFVPFPWQSDLITELDSPCPKDNRKVIWYCDVKGANGKSTCGDYLVAFKDAILFENGKTADIAFAYNGEPIVIFDFTRTTQDVLNYGVIEALLNGRVFSGKYKSQPKIFKKPWVVCFANWPPDTSKMSEDRWDIRYLDGGVVTPEVKYIATGVFEGML